MVSAINAGLSQGLFSLTAGDNRWEEGRAYPFDIDGNPGTFMLSYDAGWDEITVHACFLPKPDAARLLHCYGVATQPS